MIEIDGSFGEGGGQILRTSLALSLITQTPFRLHNIRANRQKPGLRRQHLTALLAAAEVGAAEVTGAEVGSTEIEFRPQRLDAGNYHFAIGTAGSTSLVFQTVLPPLLVAGGRSCVTFEGGTHNTGAPPFDFIAKAFVPLINRMGAELTVALERPGFAPAGGGKWNVEIDGGRQLKPMVLRDRGAIRSRCARSLLSHLPDHIGERELKVARDMLGWPAGEYRIERVDTNGPGNVMLIEVECSNITEVFVGFGERGKPAEQVASTAVHCALEYLDTGVAVGEYLADQLMLPLALARGGSYVTLRPTRHATTNAVVIGKFLPIAFEFHIEGDRCNIAIHEP